MTTTQRLVIATGVIMIVVWMSIDLFWIALLQTILAIAFASAYHKRSMSKADQKIESEDTVL